MNPCVLIDQNQLSARAESQNSKHLKCFPLAHSIMNCIDLASRKPVKSHEDLQITDSSKENYLLYGCIMVSLYEPCVMCSMALVHSRVQSLVYFEKSDHQKGAFSDPKIDFNSLKVNHKISVFEYDSKEKKFMNLDSLTD